VQFANSSQKNYALRHRLQTLIIRTHFEFWAFFHFPSKTGNFELNLVWTSVGRLLEWGKYTLGYQSGYTHSPNHRFSKLQLSGYFWYITTVLKILYSSQRTITGSFVKTFRRFLKQPEPMILGFWFFFPQRTGTANSLSIKCLKNRTGQFLKNSKNRAILVWTLKEEDVKGIMIGGLQRFKPSIFIFQLQPSSAESTMKLVTFVCKDYVEVGNQHR